MFKRILVPYDGSPTSNRGLDEAIEMAAAYGAALEIVSVMDDLSAYLSLSDYAPTMDDFLEKLRKTSTGILAEAQDRAITRGVKHVETALFERLDSSVPEMILHEAAAWHADLIVVGTHGRRGLGRALLGSTAENLARHADVPVLLVRAPESEAKSPTEPQEPVRVKVPSAAVRIESGSSAG